jgi:hypothetical protein
MPEPTEITPAMIDQLVIKDRRNNIAACVSMLATFYVSCGFDQETRLAMAELVDEYYAATKTHLRWALSNSLEGRLVSLRKKSLSSCRNRVERLSLSQSFDMNLTGAEDTDDASPFMLICLMDADFSPPTVHGFSERRVPVRFPGATAARMVFPVDQKRLRTSTAVARIRRLWVGDEHRRSRGGWGAKINVSLCCALPWTGNR